MKRKIAKGIGFVGGERCPAVKCAELRGCFLLLGIVVIVGLPFLLLTSRRKGKKPVVAEAEHQV